MTETSLISLDLSGPNPVITAQLCIGAGRTGVTNGADGNTFTFAFGFFGPGGGPVSVLNFTPNFAPMLQSNFTQCLAPGVDVGPQGEPFNTQATIGYIVDPGFDPRCGNGFTCITNTALCGNVHQECFTFTFTVSEVPDSLRVFGVEGGGNPVAGCYPNPDMLIDFTTLPVVWGAFEGASKSEGIHLHWDTKSETNNDHFIVLRSTDGNNFEEVGRVDAVGNSKSRRDYNFLDTNPPKGQSHYKIRQVDLNGDGDETHVLTLSYTPPAAMAWDFVGPTPTRDHVVLRFLSEKDRKVELSVVNMRGDRVLVQSLDAQMGSNDLDLRLGDVQPGIYFLRLRGGDAQLDYKLIKL